MQSKCMSFLEAAANIIAGYGLAVVTQLAVFPLFGMKISLSENLLIGGIFTVISLIRNYVLRRLFNALAGAGAAPDLDGFLVVPKSSGK